MVLWDLVINNLWILSSNLGVSDESMSDLVIKLNFIKLCTEQNDPVGTITNIQLYKVFSFRGEIIVPHISSHWISSGRSTFSPKMALSKREERTWSQIESCNLCCHRKSHISTTTSALS